MLERILRLFGITFVSGKEAEAYGYRLAGSDKRIGGEIGKKLGGAERDFSFQSDITPQKWVIRSSTGVLAEISMGPAHPVYHVPTPHVALAMAAGNGRFYTLRVGFRHDPNYPGYIFSIVPKFNAQQTFIEGYTQG